MSSEKINGVIYTIRNKINNKLYIGQTIRKGGFKERYWGNVEKYTHNQHLRNSIQKYGIENFEINEVFDNANTQEELDKLEDMYIKLYETTNKKYGYNKKDGGTGGRPNDELYNKVMSSCARAVVNLDNGDIYRSINDARNKGAKHNVKYHCDNVSRDKKMAYLNDFDKAVICLEDNLIFTSISECAKYYNINRSNVSSCVNHKKKCRVNGTWLKFRYINDHIFLVDRSITLRFHDWKEVNNG